MTWRHILVAGVLALASTGAALAQSTGQASLTGFGYTLADLDPLDATMPAIAFRLPEDGTLFETGLATALAIYTPYSPGAGNEETAFATEVDLLHRWAGISKENGVGHVETGGTALRNVPPDLSIDMRWETRGTGAEGARLHLVGGHEPSYFVLAPRTRVTFSALLTAQATTGTGSTHDEGLRLSVYLSVFSLRNPGLDTPTNGSICMQATAQERIRCSTLRAR